MPRPSRPGAGRRSGKILILFAILLTVLFGMLGVVLDGGLMMASHRQAQSAADSAALAAATDLMRGGTAATATATATTFVQTHNGLAAAAVAVSIPPTTGPHAGQARYVEVVVSLPYGTVFAQLGGASPTQTIAARAVAGYEPVSTGEGAIVLDPTAVPGLGFNGNNTQLKVKGSVVVNSGGGGQDQYAGTVAAAAPASGSPGISTGSLRSPAASAPLLARSVQANGGVDTAGNFKDYDDPAANPSPLYAGLGKIIPDPLRTLPVPQPSNSPSVATANGGLGWTTRQNPVSVGNSQTVTISPGIYEDIKITGGTVTFKSGVYILSPTKANQGLSISGGTITNTGNGVMFYFAASNYLTGGAGSLDAADGPLDGPLPPNTPGTPKPGNETGNVKYASLDVKGSSGSVTLTGLSGYNPNDARDQILFFGRRRTPDPQGSALYSMAGGGSGNLALNLTGVIYTKWNAFNLSGGSQYNAQFIVGTLNLSGGASMTLDATTGVNRGTAMRVFLVE